MYDRPARPSGALCRVGLVDRVAKHVGSHVGAPREYVVRLQDRARQAGLGHEPKAYRDQLLTWTSQEQVLSEAWRLLEQFGGHAPGVDGLTYSDLPTFRRWALFRSIRDAMRNGRYRASPLRSVEIPKPSGTGIRVLQLPTAPDRAVGKAILLAIESYFDALFDERSFGFRRRRGRISAIAHAMKLYEQEGLSWVVVMDIADAFGTIPRKRLFKELERHIGSGLLQVIGELANNGRKRGIPQGQPLCPVLLNVYAHRILDLMVRRLLPKVRLVRYADDLLLLCPSHADAEEAIATIQQQLRPHGWSIKQGIQVADLQRGNRVEYMGVQVRRQEGIWQCQLGEPSWRKLHQSLTQAHNGPDSTVTAYLCIQGWLRQQGFALGVDRERALSRVRQLAHELDFTEIPEQAEMLEIIEESHRQWQRTLQVEEAVIDRLGGAGSAHTTVRNYRRAGRADACPSAPPAGFFVLYTDGACLCNGSPDAAGGWAYLLQRFCHGQFLGSEGAHGGDRGATSCRMELAAVAQGLCRVPDNARVTVMSDSRYVVDTANRHLSRWANEDFFNQPRLASTVENASLWALIVEEVLRLDCTFQWVEGHAGVDANEWCDRAAVQAAHRVVNYGPFLSDFSCPKLED